MPSEIRSNTLQSPYNFVYDRTQTVIASEFVLKQIEQNVNKGLDTGIVNPATGEEIGYKDFKKLSRSIASGLFKRGFRKGDTLIYTSQESSRVSLVLLGVWRANGVVRASYPEDTSYTLLSRIKESKSRWLLCDDNLADETVVVTKQAAWDITVFNYGVRMEGCIPVQELLEDDGDECPAMESRPDDIAMILGTSGTTGPSKGAVYTHRLLVLNFIANRHLPVLDQLSQLLLYIAKPTHYGGSILIFSYIATGRRLLVTPGCEPEALLRMIHKYKPGGIHGFPYLIASAITHPNAGLFDLSSVSRITVGGVVIGPAQVSIFNMLPNFNGLPLSVYGMTEAGTFTANADLEAELRGTYKLFEDMSPYTCGKLLPGLSMQVRDLDSGENVGPGQQGELYIKTYMMCQGYFNNPKGTAESFSNGWTRTGDLGYYDEQGFIYIVDRVKDVFKYYNNHICPREIEEVILSHPGVSGACVIGIDDPTGGGSIPKAFVILKEPKIYAEDDIESFANARLESYKLLRGGLEIVDSFPLGKTGKVSKSLLLQKSNTLQQ